MPNYWLVKTEPSVYSYDDLVRDKRTVWDGVSNYAALKYMRSMKKGDLVYVYHSGDEKAIVGIAQIVRPAYPDPQDDDDRIVVVDLVPKRKLSRPVTLRQIKAHRAFASFPLVRIPRLSVMPVQKKLWDELLKMSRGKRSRTAERLMSQNSE